MNGSGGCTYHDRYYRWLASFFFVEGMDRDDLYQEARLAAWLAPSGFERTAARRQIIDLIRAAQRRPQYADLVEAESLDNIIDITAARERLRDVLETDLTDNERIAVGRRLRGEPIARHEHALDMAWFRARRKLAA